MDKATVDFWTIAFFLVQKINIVLIKCFTKIAQYTIIIK